MSVQCSRSDHKCGRKEGEVRVTGQRVPREGVWIDQYGRMTRHEVGDTFLMTEVMVDGKPKWVCAHRYYLNPASGEQAA